MKRDIVYITVISLLSVVCLLNYVTIRSQQLAFRDYKAFIAIYEELLRPEQGELDYADIDLINDDITIIVD